MDSSNQTPPPLRSGEQPLLAFVSSVMRPEFDWARSETVKALDRLPFLARWAFEYTPASSDPPRETYLRKVREADVVIWLVGEYTTEPVCREVREALASDRRLWVVKLPASRHSTETEHLLAEVQTRAKWIHIQREEDLARTLELTVKDEIIRALRGKPGLGRLARLEEIGRASRARCIALWQAAGVPHVLAAEFADDALIGTPPSDLLSSGPLVVLMGDLGAGKSLMGERVFQSAIVQARGNGGAPVPVYLKAQSASSRLQEAVEIEAQGLGNLRIQGATIVIDGADESGSGSASELLGEARVLAGTWKYTKVVITSRPIPGLMGAEEAFHIPLLSEPEAIALISRLAGHPIARVPHVWPHSVQEAIRRPLFAIILGIYLREENASVPRTKGQLLSTLVERALTRSRIDVSAGQALLERIARLVMERDGRPAPSVEAASVAPLRTLLETGLLIERSGSVSFPLQILTEWFAAHSLVSTDSSCVDLFEDLQSIERWRYPLAIATGIFSYDQVTRLLSPIVESAPAIAGEIVYEGLNQWGQEDKSHPSSLESGRRIRSAMQSWVRGIGPLADLIAPVRRDGSVRPIGVQSTSTALTTSWYQGRSELPEVMELASGFGVLKSDEEDWVSVRSVGPTGQSAWAWRYALDELVLIRK